MENSLFKTYVDKWFGMVVGKVTELFNGDKKKPTLMHKTMLTEEYSADLRWGSTELQNSVVAADTVSLDSSLPLKSRPTISNATGTLPKLGVKYRKGEGDIQQINILLATAKNNENAVVKKIFDDVPRAIMGMDIRKEIMFRQGFSSGVCLTTDANNQGTGVRVSYGYKDENKANVTVGWNTAKATPISDLRKKIFDVADEHGDTISHVWLQRKYFDMMRKSDEGKQLTAHYNNQLVTDNAILATPGRSTFLAALRDEFGAEFHIVEGSFKIEKKDGSKETVSGWDEGAIVCTDSTTVGRLVYGTLAEETNPVKQCDYQKSGSHVLVSKFSKNEPLEEFTTAQAIVLPVIDGGSSIYILKAKA